MRNLILLVAMLAATACTQRQPAETRNEQVVVRAEVVRGNPNFAKIQASSQPLADSYCAARGKTAQWQIADNRSPAAVTRLSFSCH